MTDSATTLITSQELDAGDRTLDLLVQWQAVLTTRQFLFPKGGRKREERETQTNLTLYLDRQTDKQTDSLSFISLSNVFSISRRKMFAF